MKTKLQSVLLTLSEKDINIFRSLIPTKLMEGSNQHIICLDKVLKFLQEEDSPQETISQKDRLLMSDLFSMCETYIVVMASTNDQMYKASTLMAYYRKKESEKLFTQAQQNALKKSEVLPQNADYYKYLSNIQFEKWQFDQVNSRFSNAEVEDIISNADIAIISQQLMHVVSLSAQSTLMAKTIDLGLAHHLEGYIKNKELLHVPCVALYYYALKMMLYPEDEQWFVSYSQHLEDYKNVFTAEEVKSLYFYAINYCIRKYNTGQKPFGDQLFMYYQIALDQKYLLTNGYLSRNTYRNINTLAIRMGRYDDALHISEQYISYLRKEDKESAFHFNLGSIHYAKQQYRDAMEALQKVDFSDHLSNLFAKTLLLKIYYDTQETRLLDSHLDAMQVYLTRKKIIGYHKTNYSNIIKYTRKLMMLNPYDKKAKQTLIEKVKAETSLPDKDWLLKQLEK